MTSAAENGYDWSGLALVFHMIYHTGFHSKYWYEVHTRFFNREEQALLTAPTTLLKNGYFVYLFRVVRKKTFSLHLFAPSVGAREEEGEGASLASRKCLGGA